MPDAEGRPSRIYIELDGREPSTLPQKQVGRLFFALRKDVQWGEAEALAREFGKKLSHLCINHLAAGEDLILPEYGEGAPCLELGRCAPHTRFLKVLNAEQTDA
jgi:hypothetical protein